MLKFKQTRKCFCYPEEDSEVFVLRHDVIHTTFRKGLKSKWAACAPFLNFLVMLMPILVVGAIVTMAVTCPYVPSVAGCNECLTFEDVTNGQRCEPEGKPSCAKDDIIPKTTPGCNMNGATVFSYSQLPKDADYCSRFEPSGSGKSGSCKAKEEAWENKCKIYFEEDVYNGPNALTGQIGCPTAVVGFFAAVAAFIVLLVVVILQYFLCNAATFTVYASHNHSTWADGCISGFRKVADCLRQKSIICRHEDEGPIGSYGEPIATFPLEWTFQCRTNESDEAAAAEEDAPKWKRCLPNCTIQVGKYSDDLGRKQDLIRRYLYAPFVAGSGQLHKYNHYVGKGVHMVHVAGATELDRQHGQYTPTVPGAFSRT
jgi:hypothetical protein